MDFIRIFLSSAFNHRHRTIKNDAVSRTVADIVFPKEKFVSVAEKKYKNYSHTQIELIYEMFNDVWSIYNDNSYRGLFNTLLHFTSESLVYNGGRPQVVYKSLLRWNELTATLGEDLFVCSFLANREKTLPVRRDYSWGMILNTNNTQLKYLMESEKLCELHSHLKASSDLFSVSWVCLMNCVLGREHEFCEIKSNKNIVDGIDYYNRYLRAVWLRITLFKYATGSNQEIGVVPGNLRLSIHKLDSEIKSIKMFHAEQQLDYAADSCHDCTDIFSGERRLLYLLFRKIYRGDIDRLAERYLYEYLLIKSDIRHLMIQLNENVGFANFSNYESQKESFLNNHPKYDAFLKKLPAYDAYKNHFTGYFETRITPKTSVEKLKSAYNETVQLIEEPFTIDDKNEFDYSLIYHFIKIKDHKSPMSILAPRNHNARVLVKKQAIALRSFISRKDNLSNTFRDYVPDLKISGIDAANSEFFCRPEVFAQAYRYLRDLPLSFTYHVGEDFYDMADGLRAVEEAVLFLGMTSGDRLGHCIVLGLDVYNYYKSRNRMVILPRQELLDNIVWLYVRSKAIGVVIPPAVEYFIEHEFIRLTEIYRKYLNETEFSILDYYDSMLLRGNDPSLKSPSQIRQLGINSWDSFAVDEATSHIYTLQKPVALYNLYHNCLLRKYYDEVKMFKIPDGYEAFIDDMRKALLQFVADKGLSIECCPSSNFKIARLERFENHPIFQFSGPQPERSIVQATVNTDDLGVFHTSLDKEYSLLALALEKQVDSDGCRIYSNKDIKLWITELIRNGKSCSFT